jgi:hypothetical protein
MKAGIYILSWCLLAALLMSLFQYIPVSEDELTCVKTELSKKAKESSEKDTDEDPDADEEDDFLNSSSVGLDDYNSRINACLSKNLLYSFLLINKFNPPPRLQS